MPPLWVEVDGSATNHLHFAGVWESLVIRAVWDREIVGSNPITPPRLCSLNERTLAIRASNAESETTQP